MTTNDKDIVPALRSALTERIGAERFALWFEAGTRLVLEPGTLRVEVPSRFFQDWIAANFRQDLVETCRAVRGDYPAIEFCIVAPPAGAAEARSAKSAQSLPSTPSAQTPGALVRESRAASLPNLASAKRGGASAA